MGEVISEKCFRHMCPQRSLISFLCFAHKSLYAQTHLPSRNAQCPHRIRLPCFCFPFLNIFCSFCCYFVMNVNCMWLFVCRVGWLDDFAFCILIHIRFGVFNMLYTRNKCIALLYRFFLCLSSPPPLATHVFLLFFLSFVPHMLRSQASRHIHAEINWTSVCLSTLQTNRLRFTLVLVSLLLAFFLFCFWFWLHNSIMFHYSYRLRC